MIGHDGGLTRGQPALPGGGETDPRRELAELAGAVRAYVEWQADTGSTGLVVDADPAAVLALLGAAPAPGGTRPAPVGAAPHRDARPTMTGEARAPAAPAFATPAWAAPSAGPPQAAAPPPAARPATATPAAAPPAAPPPPATPRATPVATGAPSPAIAPAPSDGDERRTRLALLAEEVRACTRCVLHEKRKQTVFSRGDPFSELAFIGEGPGADEDALGEPFVGAAGQLLDRMIAAMGYRRDAVYVANIVKCRPPSNRKPEVEEMASCMPFLVQQLGLVRPKVIVALGATAVQGLCGTTEGITRLRGKWKIYKGSVPIMPTFHPAYLLRSPAAKREVWLDLQEVMKHLGRPVPSGQR